MGSRDDPHVSNMHGTSAPILQPCMRRYARKYDLPIHVHSRPLPVPSLANMRGLVHQMDIALPWRTKVLSMSRIIIATDFSADALHAAHYAAHLFGNTDVTYVLVHAHFDPGTMVFDPGSMEQAMPPYAPVMLDAAREGLAAAAKEFVELTGAASVEHQLLLGPLPQALLGMVEERGANAFVVGTKGRSGKGLFGSNASDVIRTSTVPVITVPGRASLAPINRIILADDCEVMDPNKLSILRLIALRHKAEVLIAHVDTGKTGAEVTRARAAVLLPDVTCSVLEPKGTDVVDGLIEAARENKANMIAVLHRHKGLLGRLLHTSVAKELALDTELPLLVLEQEEG